jgi:hypothetical protein
MGAAAVPIASQAVSHGFSRKIPLSFSLTETLQQQSPADKKRS